MRKLSTAHCTLFGKTNLNNTRREGEAVIITKLTKDRFVRNNLILFIGSFFVAVLSYLYYPVLARLMNINDFGEVQTLVTIFNQAALIFGAINIVTVVLVASSNNQKRNEVFILELQKLMIYAVVAIGLVAIIFSPLLKSFFNFQSVWPFFAMVLALLLNAPIAFWMSYMQGKENFSGMNILGILGAGGKLIASAVLVVVGFGSFGAIFGLFLGQLVALGYVGQKYDVPSFKKLIHKGLPRWQILRTELRYTSLVFSVTLLITLLYSGDILIVKHYQSAEVAGLYAGISSIARIIFFLTLPFAMVLLPAVSNNPKERRSTLRKSLMYVIGLGSLTCAVFWLAKTQIITILIGSRYNAMAYILPRLSLAILFIAISNILFYYLLAMRSIKSLLIASIGVIVFITMSVLYHATPDQVVNNLLVASTITVILLVLELSIMPRLMNFLKIPKMLGLNSKGE